MGGGQSRRSLGAMEGFSLLVLLHKCLGSLQCLASDITIYGLGPLRAKGQLYLSVKQFRPWAVWAEQHGAAAAGAQLTGLRAELRLLWRT